MAKQDPAAALGAAGPAVNGTAPADALVRAFNDLRDELLSTLVFVLGNPEDARDAAQDAFVKCWNAREQLPQVLNLRAWIFRVCFNTAKDMKRSAWHRRSRPLCAEQYTVAARDLGAAEALERRE